LISFASLHFIPTGTEPSLTTCLLSHAVVLPGFVSACIMSIFIYFHMI